MAHSESLGQLGAKLKAQGRGDLRRQLLATIRKQTGPLRDAAKQSALDNLPKTGGINQIVAAAKFSTRTSLSVRSARVRIIAAERHDIKAIDEGVLRHPVYGNRKVWATTKVTPGWWTRPMQAGSPHVRAAIVRTVNEIGRRL